jgi:TPR repeat protein
MIRTLADSGFIEATFVYDGILQEGKLTKQNMFLAPKYCQEAAKANHLTALCRSGKLAKVEEPALALELFKSAADLGFLDVQYYCGRMLESSGIGSESVKYYSVACTHRLAKAQFRFGRCREVFPKEHRGFAVAADFYELAAV